MSPAGSSGPEQAPTVVKSSEILDQSRIGPGTPLDAKVKPVMPTVILPSVTVGSVTPPLRGDWAKRSLPEQTIHSDGKALEEVLIPHDAKVNSVSPGLVASVSTPLRGACAKKLVISNSSSWWFGSYGSE